jgi:hypothetical protein
MREEGAVDKVWMGEDMVELVEVHRHFKLSCGAILVCLGWFLNFFHRNLNLWRSYFPFRF